MPEILIADSTQASVSFSVLNMFEEQQEIQSGNVSPLLYCTVRPYDNSINSNQGIVKVLATLKRDRVQCSSAFFNYSDSMAYRNYTLELSKANEMIDKTSGSFILQNSLLFFSYFI